LGTLYWNQKENHINEDDIFAVPRYTNLLTTCYFSLIIPFDREKCYNKRGFLLLLFVYKSLKYNPFFLNNEDLFVLSFARDSYHCLLYMYSPVNTYYLIERNLAHKSKDPISVNTHYLDDRNLKAKYSATSDTHYLVERGLVYPIQPDDALVHKIIVSVKTDPYVKVLASITATVSPRHTCNIFILLTC
jgi:hypothetical protein